ncbi:MAG: sensor histidine kinase [Saprospiraceae bacterium]
MTLIHIVLIVLTFYLLRDYKIYFIVSEAAILLSIAISIIIYKKLIHPIRFILTGTDAIRDQDFNVKFVKTGTKEMDSLIDVYNEMIDKLRIERTKQSQQHYFLDNLIAASPTGILILDFDENISSMNPAIQKMLELDNYYLNKSLNQQHPILSELSKLESGYSKIISINGIKAFKCQKSHFIDRGFNHHFVLVEELSSEILQTEKNAYEKVIRMMAHEVNNSIGPINSILHTSLEYSPQLEEEDKQDFEEVMNVAINRNDKLNQFMRNFADVVRLPIPRKEKKDLNVIIEDIQTLFSNQLKEKNITFELSLDKNPFIEKLDIQQIEQALVNIVKNASEAIEGEGKIHIKTNVQNRELIISDTGTGIPKELEPQLFTPFFSTKRDGQGIGLTLIREILMNHDCEFSLKTISPKHTEFRIRFLSCPEKFDLYR